MSLRPQGRALLAALALACLPAAGRAGTASNQLCTAAGKGAGCIGTPQVSQGSDAPAPQVNPAAAAALTGAAGGLIGGALGNALATPTNSPRYEHKEVKPVVGDDDDIPAKTDVDDAQDVIRLFAQPKVHPPASEWQVEATIAELQPLLTHRRSKVDPKLADCESGCGCPKHKKMVCTPTCTGTCYKLGGKDSDPDGKGIDCSGLIAQENPCYWYKECGKGKAGPELNCANEDGTACAGGGAARELAMLRRDKLDNKDKATSLNAGDVVFFSEDGAVGHVVQVTSDPVCNANGCMMAIIQAPHSGVPVEEAVFIIDKHGQTSKVLPDPNGGWILQSTNLVMTAGGTPPAGPKTGGGKTE